MKRFMILAALAVGMLTAGNIEQAQARWGYGGRGYYGYRGGYGRGYYGGWRGGYRGYYGRGWGYRPYYGYGGGWRGGYVRGPGFGVWW
jgi:hypothetical protein